MVQRRGIADIKCGEGTRFWRSVRRAFLNGGGCPWQARTSVGATTRGTSPRSWPGCLGRTSVPRQGSDFRPSRSAARPHVARPRRAAPTGGGAVMGRTAHRGRRRSTVAIARGTRCAGSDRFPGWGYQSRICRRCRTCWRSASALFIAVMIHACRLLVQLYSRVYALVHVCIAGSLGVLVTKKT